MPPQSRKAMICDIGALPMVKPMASLCGFRHGFPCENM
jgi:hypothetical protein